MGNRPSERPARKASAPRIPPWGPTASREEARAYVQRRLALFTTLWLWILVVFALFITSLYLVNPETRPPGADIVDPAGIVTILALALIWRGARGGTNVTLEVLYAVDALTMVVLATLFGMSAYFSADLLAAVYSAFIWSVLLLFSRVIVVPSTARRTAAVAGAAAVPILLAAIGLAANKPDVLDIPPAFFLGGASLFIATGVVLAIIGSGVIYGLQTKVREARHLGQYTLDEKIGEGGMGVVYRARHAMLRRPTAIKLLQPSKVDADSLARFEREVQHTSRLSHPNTVAIFDYGRSLDDVFYYAMEYLEGIDLERLVRRDGAQPAARVVRILRQVCGALDEAHRLGLTHRDIKPANIILCRHGGQLDVAKVVDFGLVHEIAADDGSMPRAVVGTPAYLSPEAVTDPERVGPSSDLYALGAVGYWLLTGQRVFTASTVVEVCMHHVTSPVVAPSERTGNPIPQQLETLVLSCLAKDPDQRPASARTLAAALSKLVVEPEWEEEQAESWWRRFDAVRIDAGVSQEDAVTDARVTLAVDVHGRTELAPAA